MPTIQVLNGQTYLKTYDDSQGTNNNDVFQDVLDMNFPIQPNRVYWFRFSLLFTLSGGACGAKFQLLFPSLYTQLNYTQTIYGFNANAYLYSSRDNATAAAFITPGPSGVIRYEAEGFLAVDSTPDRGDVQAQYAQVVSDPDFLESYNYYNFLQYQIIQ